MALSSGPVHCSTKTGRLPPSEAPWMFKYGHYVG